MALAKIVYASMTGNTEEIADIVSEALENLDMEVEINDDEKKLLICDRNILKGVSWDELNDQNLIFGKVVILEDKKYILRLLTGYSEKKKNSVNEWDKYIVNSSKINELPISSSFDIDTNSKQVYFSK